MPRTLSTDMTGEDVRALQRLLNYHLPAPARIPLAEDTIFGPKTKARVIEFQTLNSLLVDGIVGGQTRETLLDSRTFTYGAVIAPVSSPQSAGRLGTSSFGISRLSPVVLAQAGPTTQPAPATPPAGPAVNVQRTVQFQAGQQVSLAPYFLSPLVVGGQISWLFRRDGTPDSVFTVAGQFAFNQQSGPKPSGGWTGQGSVQWGPTGFLKVGDFDLLNPFVTLMLQQNQGQPPSLGFGIGNQINWTLWSRPNPNVPNTDSRNLGLFINGQLVTNTFLPFGTPPPGGLPFGQFSAPSGQILGGVSWTMDWPFAK
jgi:peptidoglycan hydrolase-like protein with peptidoglycan-binding domain